MDRRAFLRSAVVGAAGAVLAARAAGRAHTREDAVEKTIGLYVHQHWPYHHPYAARTWTLADWRGWARGIRRLGYNTFLIWPMLETMPDPLTPSDRRYLERLGRVVDMLHTDFGMRAYLALCPNIAADSAEARRATYEARHYYYCDRLVNPGDPDALDRLVRWRETLLRPLAKVDGVAIIDSDPGCYPGSTNQEFVDLLVAHRRMLDRLRSGIELIYWMHAGWRGWSRFYETGKQDLGTPEEQLDTLTRLVAADPEPWGLANGLPYAEKLGVAHKVIRFNYGLIEGEPSFPMTNFGGRQAHDGGASPGPRGVMGNAQTHCVQLPSIFAFARGAAGRDLADDDYAAFADELIVGLGGHIVAGWRALVGDDAEAMRASAAALRQAAAPAPRAGPLRGLLLGDPRRFLTDLEAMLRMRASRQDFVAAAGGHGDARASLRSFVEAAGAWQRRHGYENYWWDGGLFEALRTLRAPAVDAVLAQTYEAHTPFDAGVTTPGEQVRRNFHRIETFTPRLLAAMREVAG